MFSRIWTLKINSVKTAPWIQPGNKRFMGISQCKSCLSWQSCSSGPDLLSAFERIPRSHVKMPWMFCSFPASHCTFTALFFVLVTETRHPQKPPCHLSPPGFALLWFRLYSRAPVSSEPRGERVAGCNHSTGLLSPYRHHCSSEDRTADPRSGQCHIQQQQSSVARRHLVNFCDLSPAVRIIWSILWIPVQYKYSTLSYIKPV